MKYFQNYPKIKQNLFPCDQIGFNPEIQGCFYICKFINIIHNINRLTEKTYVIISLDEKHEFDKVQHIFLMNDLKLLGDVRNRPEHNKFTINKWDHVRETA